MKTRKPLPTFENANSDETDKSVDEASDINLGEISSDEVRGINDLLKKEGYPLTVDPSKDKEGFYKGSFKTDEMDADTGIAAKFYEKSGISAEYYKNSDGLIRIQISLFLDAGRFVEGVQIDYTSKDGKRFDKDGNIAKSSR